MNSNFDIQRLWKKAHPDSNGLLPCVVQDIRTNAVLMVAWVSKEALVRAIESGWATFWSRSRAQLWEKGKSSGHRQRLVEVRLDCDGDTLLYRVDPLGPACHEGNDTCFSWRRVGSGWRLEPESVLGEVEGRSQLFEDLERLLSAKSKGATHSDEETKEALFEFGLPEQGVRLRETAEQIAHSLTGGNRDAVIDASADLLFTLAVALRSRRISLDQVFAQLLHH